MLARARGDRLAVRDRRPPGHPQLVLPPRVLAGEPPGLASAQAPGTPGAGLSLAAAQLAGLVLLGFSSVYREGFETVIFLQAMTFEADAWTVLEGVARGLAGVVAGYVLVIALERKLPHKKMLIATGILITAVLVVMVGTTVQTLQAVGWLPVSPIERLELPYWSGLWLGIHPTWQRLAAQTAAIVFVVGSYVAAEGVQKRRRARRISSTVPVTAGSENR